MDKHTPPVEEMEMEIDTSVDIDSNLLTTDYDNLPEENNEDDYDDGGLLYE